MKGKQLAAALRLGHAIPAEQVAEELDRLVTELVALQLWQTNLINRIKSLPRRGMQDGYSTVRYDHVMKAVDRKLAQLPPEEDDE